MATIRDIQIEELFQLIAEGAQLIDIREEDEREDGSIEGHIHIPLSSLDERRDDLATDKTLIFYCQSGKRSQKACLIVESWGFDQDLCSLAGGLEDFLNQGS